MIKYYNLKNELLTVVPMLDSFIGYTINNLANWTRYWYLGRTHRLDGPAFIYFDGIEEYKQWYVHGLCVTEEEHRLYVDLLKLKGLL